MASSAGVNSWGKTLTSRTIATAAGLQFVATTVPLRTVTDVDGTSFTNQMLMRFSGMGGNELLSQQTAVFDVKGGRFGIVKT